MIAAIYARKSTEQNGVKDEEKSVTRQIEHAKLYAAKKGWTIADEHIYVDDGISGAEFKKRPGFLRLLNSLSARPAFQVLIMSEESRLGRESIETGYVLKQIIDAGVRVFFYLDDRERTLDSAMDKVMLSLTNFAAEMEREKARQRTYDAMLRKAKALQVTGGKVFGYDNVEIPSSPDQTGRQKRLYVVRKINAEQAAVVRRIFEMYASGAGITRIAKALNADKIAPPRKDAKGWAPTAIREILHRSLYRGEVVWNKSQKIMRRGTKGQRKRPEDQWLRINAPELRIVSDELWHAVCERLESAGRFFSRSRSGGHLLGRPSYFDGESPYLLTGFTECSICNGAIGGITQFHGSGPVENRKRATFYGCNFHRKRGDHVCDNDVVLRTEAIDHAVLDGISTALEDWITGQAIDAALEKLRAGHEHHLDRRAQVERELSLVETRLSRIVEAITSGGTLDTLVTQLRAEEARKKELVAELERLPATARPASIEPATVKQDLRDRAADVRELLHAHMPQARQMLRTLLDGKLLAEPLVEEGRYGYRLTGNLNIGRLLKAEVYEAIVAASAASSDNSEALVAPTGFEPLFQP